MARKILDNYHGNTILIDGVCYSFVGETTTAWDTDESEIQATYDSCQECNADESSSSSSSEGYSESSSSSSEGYSESSSSSSEGYSESSSSSSSEGYLESSSSSLSPATTTLVNVTSTGDATTIESGTINLEEGALYFFSASLGNAGSSGDFRAYLNSDTTNTNYYRAQVSTNGSAIVQAADNNSIYTTTEANKFNYYSGIVGLQNSRPYILADCVKDTSVRRAITVGEYHVSDTNLTNLQFTANVSNNIKSGSKLKIWKLDQEPIVDVSATSSITTMSSGTISLTSGKVYMFAVGINTDTVDSFQLRINENVRNYIKGGIGSQYIGNSSTAGSLYTDNFAVAWGYCGLLLKPYLSYSFIEETSASNCIIRNSGAYHTKDSSFTKLDIVSVAGGNIKSGSWLKIWGIGV